MSSRLTRRQICLGAAVLAVTGLLVCSAHAGGKGRGRPIEFSVPKGEEVSTNLHQFATKRDGLKDLEEELYQPLQSFSPRSSLEGVAAPPPRAPVGPAVQSKRVKELLERRKNWVFMTPEDLLAAPTIEDILKSPQFGLDGQERKERPVFERYYRRLSINRDGANKQMQSRTEEVFLTPAAARLRDPRAPHDDSDLPGGVRQSAEELTRLFEPGNSDSPFAERSVHASFSDTFGLGNNMPSKEQVLQHRKLMDDYRSVVDPNWRPPNVGGPANSLSLIAHDAPLAAEKPPAALPSTLNSTPRSALEIQRDITDPLLGPPALPDLNAQAVGQMRPAPALPSADVRRVGPVAPTFAAPKRAF